MAITIVGTGLSGNAQWGVASEETGVNVESIEVRAFREVNEKLPGIKNQTRGRALANAFSRDVTLNGEVIGATGLMALTAANEMLFDPTAYFANSLNAFGTQDTIDVATLVFDEGTVTQNRSGWRSVSMKFSADPVLNVPL